MASFSAAWRTVSCSSGVNRSWHQSQTSANVPVDQFKASLASVKDNSNARFVLTPGAKGTVWFDMVSLFPANTFKNHPNGLRDDVAQMIADLKPGFVRFPGGCWVEGEFMNMAYRWKDTLGDLSERRRHQ